MIDLNGRLNDKQIGELLEQTQAIRHGHFKLTSGRHSDTYIQCARVLERPDITNALAREAVLRLPKDARPELVISPAVGGILFGFAVATALNLPFIFTERVEGKMQLRRSFEIPPGARVLIAEDVVTTGGSVKEVEDVVTAFGGVVVGTISLIDRGGKPKFNSAFYPLLRFETPSWEPELCGLCVNGTQIDSPGSRNLAKP